MSMCAKGRVLCWMVGGGVLDGYFGEQGLVVGSELVTAQSGLHGEFKKTMDNLEHRY